MKYKNGEKAKVGDVIRWNTWDNEEYTTWTFTGLVTSDGVVYLGGGIDFGLGIGKVLSYESVCQQSEDNDSTEYGIEKVGIAADLYRYISEFNTKE